METKASTIHFTIQYKPGKSNAVDYMSRHPCKRSTPELSSIAEEYVKYVTENAVPKALTLEKIGEETRKDVRIRHFNMLLMLSKIKNKCHHVYSKTK